MCYVINKRGNSTIETLLQMFPLRAILTLFVSILILLIIFKYLLNEKFSKEISLDILRIL